MHHKKNKRHTVPNSNYPSFPFYQEEIELKTNLVDCNNLNLDTSQSNIEFSMQDKLKMCFSEMQNLKDHFDNRRRRFPCKKKTQNLIPDLKNKESNEFLNLTSSENIQSTSQQNKTYDDNDGSKFKAHLIRTRSKDSIDEECPDNLIEFSTQKNSHSNIYKEISQDSILPPNSYKRTASDPFKILHRNNEDQFLSNPKLIEMEQSNPELENKKKQGFNEWLKKLEEINDMSRSTIDRIKRLENDIFTLRNSTQQLDLLKSPKILTSKIPVHTNNVDYIPTTNRITKRTDKSLNTDIDMELMNKLLKYWNSRKNENDFNLSERKNPQQSSLKDHTSTIRRLTTTISRSVKIQTDTEEKSFEERGVLTDDVTDLNKSKSPDEPKVALEKTTTNKQNTEPIPILDLPIVEKPIIAKTINTFHVCAEKFDEHKPIDNDDILANVRTTPEPIVEMYSDSDDNYFEDFEKDIFNEISRRALIRNKIISRSRMDFYHDDSSKTKLRNSATQTINKDFTSSINKNINEENPLLQKKLHSTSKIVIERVRADQKDKREIILQTDIEKDGKIRRTTEIRNNKQRLPTDLIKIENECYPPNMEYEEDNIEDKKSAQNQVKQLFPRTQSAFDLTDNDVLTKTDDDFLSNKAFSSLDISSKSPVISEGYHSERLDSQRLSTPQNYFIEPPESFRSTPAVDNFGEVNSSKKSFLKKSSPKEKNNSWVMNSETLIENIGNEMNITTKSSTIRKPKLNTSPKTLNTGLSGFEKGESSNRKKSNDQDLNSEKLIDLNYNEPTFRQEKGDFFVQPFRNDLTNECKFSLIYNYGTNVVFRADFGISKLPLFETNL